MQNGDLYVWGAIGVASQTNSSYTISRRGVHVTTPKKFLTNVKSAYFSNNLYAAITEDNSLYMWGASIGYTIPDGQAVSNIYETPYKVESIGPVKDVIFDDGLNVAAITTSGDLYIWGASPGFGANSEPKKILENVKQASMSSVLAAVTNDNKLYVHKKSDSYIFPKNLEKKYQGDMVLINENVASVQGFTSAFSYLDMDGGLWTCGNESSLDMLGHGNIETSDDGSTPKKILDNVGEYGFNTTSYAITKDGNLYSWGRNNNGKAGVGSSDSHIYTPTLVMNDVEHLIESDTSTNMGVIKKDHTLWNWGTNNPTSVGNGKEGYGEYEASPVKILDNVKIAVRSTNHVLALKTDGSLWAWGYNYAGRTSDDVKNTICGPLGDFTTIDRLSPILITLQGPSPSVNDNPDEEDTSSTPITPVKPVTPTKPVISTPTVVPKKVTKISLSGISKKLAAGSKVSLSAKITPSNASNKKLIWKSSNKKIATVSSKGLVTINKKAGGKSVIITATAADSGKVKASYKISIMKGKVTKISLKGKSTVKAGKSIKLKATVKTSGKANKQVRFTSSNTKYATVSSKGVVKATKAGKGKKVTITAIATDGTGKKAKKKITIK